eukprot:COSAG02_NODE_12746_length_1500_cov_2.900785_2_plen_178_part_00
MIGPKTYRSGTENKKSLGGKELCETGLAWGRRYRERLSRTRPPPKLGRPVVARLWSARVGTRPTCSAYPGPAPPPTCHLGGVDLLTNKATRERAGGRAALKMTRGAKCGLSCDWQESGEDPKLSTFSIHSVACDKDLIFFFMPQRPPNHVGQYRCGMLLHGKIAFGNSGWERGIKNI